MNLLGRLLVLASAAAAGGIAPVGAQTTGIGPAQKAAVAPVAEGYATTPDGIRLYYRVAGSGKDTVIAPFALYHGNALDALAEGRRVVTYDPRGRGKSQAAPLDRVSLDFLLSDLDTVRRAVGAERVALIGWSGGGMETFVYTLRNPERVSRLVQLAPVTARAQPYTDEMTRDRERRMDPTANAALQARIASGEFAGDPVGQCRAENAIFSPALMADPSKAGLLPDVCDSPNEQPPAIGEFFGALWPSISTFDWRPSLEELTVPRLVVYPLQDNITRAGVEEWVRGQESARIVYVDDAGHFPHYEQPQTTIAAIATFLAGEWPHNAVSLPAE